MQPRAFVGCSGCTARVLLEPLVVLSRVATGVGIGVAIAIDIEQE
jgi:hypothetical protein